MGTSSTGKPGEQFVLRREVFRRVQEAFQQNGIQFAVRRVIVDTPATDTVAAAAAAAAVIHAYVNKPREETAP